MQKLTESALLPGWPDSKTPTFAHWAFIEGQPHAWGRTRWNPMCRCLVTRVPIYTHNSVPLSEAAGAGWGQEGRELQSPADPETCHTWGRVSSRHMAHASLLLPDMFCVSLTAWPMPSLYCWQGNSHILS